MQHIKKCHSMVSLNNFRSKTLKRPKKPKAFITNHLEVEKGKVTVSLPIETVSEMNESRHWTKKRRLHLRQKWWVNTSLSTVGSYIKTPCCVCFTRLSPGTLDDDNLVVSFKFFRDAVAAIIMNDYRPGRADSSPLITWEYKQEKNKLYGTKITITYAPL